MNVWPAHRIAGACCAAGWTGQTNPAASVVKSLFAAFRRYTRKQEAHTQDGKPRGNNKSDEGACAATGRALPRAEQSSPARIRCL
jgi:hypothetical protein